ncbi:hypothetical protein ACOBR2_17280 [Telmatobacter bradus]|uniref:hypothetical protein n=1 Tax=Telmatobacter bradus TaxID=474953 RepID=UPI003B436551
MKRMRPWLVFAAILAASAALAAQQKEARASFVYPAGGQVGTSFDVRVGGDVLDGTVAAIFTGDGVTASIIHFDKSFYPAEADALNQKLKDLEQSHATTPASAKPTANDPQKPAEAPRPTTPWTPEDRKLAAAMHYRLDWDARLRSAPAFAQAVTLHVTISSHAALGNHELRLLTNKGLTPPLVFLVGHLPENSLDPQFVPMKVAAGGGVALAAQAHADPSPPPQTIALPMIVNGQIMPGMAESYRFAAHKGQKIVIAALTRTLIPYMADAVPGWFQASLTLTDSSGKELATADHFRFSQEPVIETEIPADGDYLLTVRDILNRGREDFLYRIAIGELPYVTGIFPLGGPAEKRTRIALSGWNLPLRPIKSDAYAPGVHSFVAEKDGWQANTVAFSASTLKESVEANPATDAQHAHNIHLPVVLNGRIEKPGTGHYFRLHAEAGQQMVAEVEARRLGSPLDSTLTLFDAKGHQLAFNDDSDEKDAPLLTHQADSRLEYHFTAPGTYLLRIADSQQNGGPDYAYRLRVGPAQPDFQVRIAPSSINLRPGRNTPVRVLLLRRDGFQGTVKLRIKSGPAGLVLGGAEIPAGVDAVRVTLTAPPEAFAAPQRLILEAVANIDGVEEHREVEAVDDNIQAFAWHESVPAQQALLWSIGKEHRKPIWPVFGNRIVLPKGGSATLQLTIPQGLANNHFSLTLDDPPPGISIAEVKQNGTTLQARLSADSSFKQGLEGNLIAEIFMEKSVAADQKAPNKNKPAPFDVLPAIPFAVMPSRRQVE